MLWFGARSQTIDDHMLAYVFRYPKISVQALHFKFYNVGVDRFFGALRRLTSIGFIRTSGYNIYIGYNYLRSFDLSFWQHYQKNKYAMTGGVDVGLFLCPRYCSAKRLVDELQRHYDFLFTDGISFVC